ncbi:MAG: ParB/RepB/Spo0J family partition protein [Candidatus Nomurabacteria bacterium]|jgi:ParB family chromosome partitioning protein|nr:ParB/RepB/Spo0J family partition protein [Candidatus Nomurabacteria bacterium]
MAKGLGRGFESLIPTDVADEDWSVDISEAVAEPRHKGELKNVPLANIESDPSQPRRDFDAESLQALATSIAEHGVLQPVVLKPVASSPDRYQIIAGERRFRASKIAGRDTIPALIRDVSDQNRLELALVENVQREDLAPLEKARAYRRLKDEFNMSLEEIGKRVDRGFESVKQTLRLLNLPEAAKEFISAHRLTEGQVKPLIGLPDDIIMKVLPRIIDDKLTVAEIKKIAEGARRNKIIQIYEREKQVMAKALNLPVNVRTTGANKGTVSIQFKSENELRDIIKSITGRDFE